MLEVTETLLEMHYHRAFVELFEEVFGAKFLRLLKPSTRTEGWVGFDQGWVRTRVPNQQLMRELRAYAEGTLPKPSVVLGYFMQFKVVHQKKRRSITDPPNLSPPYFRSELSLDASKITGISQHETLLRISKLPGADVSYCCPFLFHVDDIYEDPDLDEVKVVDVNTAPPGWATGGEHYIVFRDDTDAPPIWCS